MKCLLLTLLAIAALLPSQGEGASAVHLKDGNVRRGEIIEQTAARIKLDTGDGNIYAFSMKDIEKIVREIPVSVDIIHLKKGGIYKGEIVEETTDRLKLKTDEGNIHAFFLEEIEKRTKGTNVKYETWFPSQQEEGKPQQVILRSEKSPALALVLSMFVIPGSGQWYNGESGKGWTFFLTGVGGAVLMIAGLEEATTQDMFGNTYTTGEGGGKIMLGSLLVLTTSIWGGIDAYKSAQRINRERYAIQFGKRNLAVSLEPVVRQGDVGGRVRLRMPF